MYMQNKAYSILFQLFAVQKREFLLSHFLYQSWHHHLALNFQAL
jgi:hypothetical protein